MPQRIETAACRDKCHIQREQNIPLAQATESNQEIAFCGRSVVVSESKQAANPVAVKLAIHKSLLINAFVLNYENALPIAK